MQTYVFTREESKLIEQYNSAYDHFVLMRKVSAFTTSYYKAEQNLAQAKERISGLAERRKLKSLEEDVHLVISEGVREIPEGAFEFNYLSRKTDTFPPIISVDFPKSLTAIGSRAFSWQAKLTHVALPPNIRKVGYRAFFGCTDLRGLSIPDGTDVIGAGAFRNCTSLKSVTIPDSITSIGPCAFSECPQLKTAGPIGGGANIEIAQIRSIPPCAFKECESLESAIIPNSVSYIGESAFEDCASLKTVVMGTSVKSIKKSAFRLCRSLATITIPNSVTYIGENAFEGCSSLETVIIPDSVTGIEENAFDGCMKLRCIFLPRKLKSVSSASFSKCPNLKYVFYHPEIERRVLKSFPDADERSLLLVPTPCESAEFPPTSEKVFASIVESSLDKNVKTDNPSAVEAAVEEAKQAVSIDVTADKTDAVEGDLMGYFKLALRAETDARVAAQYLLRMQQATLLADKLRCVFNDLSTQITKWMRLELNDLSSDRGRSDYLTRSGLLAGKPKEPGVPQRNHVTMPESPIEPTEPVYEKPGLFGKKAVLQRNELARLDYEKKINEFKTAMENYEREVKQLKALQEAEYAKAIEEHEEQKRQYQESMAEFDKRCEKAIDERMRELEQAISEIDSSSSDLDSVISIYAIEEQVAEEALRNALSHLEFIYSCDAILPKYRTLPAVATMCEYLETGRCTDLAGPNGAYNLYESEIRANCIIAQLDMIQESLNDIKNNQYRLYEAVVDVHKSVDKLNRNLSSKLQGLLDSSSGIKKELESMSEDVSSIKKSSAAGAYFAERSVELASQEKVFFGFAF